MINNSSDWHTMDRRSFVRALMAPAALSLVAEPGSFAAQGAESVGKEGPDIIDCNVHLFDWPFRKLKYASTEALAAKLRKHRITKAWAGSFEGVLHSQFDAANRR